MTIFYILILFALIAAVIAAETKNLLSAVICVGAVGFFSSLMFLFLKAPDIAITQIVVEVLALIILIRATISRDKFASNGEKYLFGTAIAGVLLLAVFMGGIRLLDSMPEFGKAIFEIVDNSASKTYIARGLDKTGASNLVASVILDFRAYDTLGEATVLFTSIIGATVILRKKSKKALEDPDE